MTQSPTPGGQSVTGTRRHCQGGETPTRPDEAVQNERFATEAVTMTQSHVDVLIDDHDLAALATVKREVPSALRAAESVV